MNKYISLFLSNFAISLEYRSRVVLDIISTVIGLLVFIVFWIIVYQSKDSIGGLTLSETLLYYSLAPLVGFITKVYIGDQIGSEIRSGYLSSYIIRPARIWYTYFSISLARKAATLLTTVPIYLVIVISIVSWQHYNFFTFGGVVAGTLIAILTYLSLFVLDLIIGAIAFWVTDIWWFSHLKQLLFGIFAGMSFPFEFLPEHLQGLFNFLPFKFAYYIPISYLQSTRDLSNLIPDIVQLLVWTVGFTLLAGFVWKKGLIKYDAYGN